MILSSTYGDGHKQVANAISEAINLSISEYEPIILNVMEIIHPHSHQISHFLYMQGIKKFPQLYGYLYKKTYQINTFSKMLNTFLLMGMHSILQILQEEKPAIVVSTYPFAAGVMSKLKEKGLTDIPAVTVITDYTNHSYWIHPLTDKYIVGSEHVQNKLIEIGIDRSKIANAGIPIRPRFFQGLSRKLLKEKYGLNPNVFTLLIMGGGLGLLGKGLSSIRQLESITSPIQILILCGRNEKLKKRLEIYKENSKHDIILLGFTEDVNELMMISDLLITKPGGVTVTEAISMELPLLIHYSLPGQEEENETYLMQSGVAMKAENDEDLAIKIQGIINNPRKLQFFQQKEKQLQKKTSLLETIGVILGYLDQAM